MSTLPALDYLSDAARTQGEEKTAFEDQLAAVKQIPGAGVAEQALTIAAGSVTPAAGASGLISIDTEAAAASDDLTNIVQTNVPDGSVIVIRCTNNARAVVVKHNAGGAGLVSLANSLDATLNTTTKFLWLKRTGTLWEEIPPRAGSLDITMAGTAINEAAASVAAHATTCDIWTGGNEITLTGSVVTFTALAAAPQAGAVRWVKSNAAHVLTNNAALAVQGGATYTLAANDWVRVEAITTTTFSLVIFRADGRAVVGSVPIAAAGGTVDAITATFSPALTLSDMVMCRVVCAGANATTTPTFAPNGLTAHTITKRGGAALIAGDIPASGFVADLEYNLAGTRWELLNPAAAPESLVVACSDETTALATGTGKVTFRMPYAFTVTGVRASLTTAQTSGSIFTVDINESGTTILSTKLTIDNNEKTSTTAATPAVVSDASLADDAEMTVDIDQIGNGTAKGLKIMLIGRRT